MEISQRQSISTYHAIKLIAYEEGIKMFPAFFWIKRNVKETKKILEVQKTPRRFIGGRTEKNKTEQLMWQA